MPGVERQYFLWVLYRKQSQKKKQLQILNQDLTNIKKGIEYSTL
nr:MAG TPA: hypothetical protein [Caudoviricetes sp.]